MSKASSAPLNPEDSHPILVHVTAPSTLPEGYTFEAEINGDPDKVITVEVPEGGVIEGKSFLAPLPPTYNAERLKVPTGRWKDGLFDFCSVGVLHPSLWCSIVCTPIAMAQVITRAQLTWLGEPGPFYSTRKSFKVIVILLCSYFVFSTAMELASASYVEGSDPPMLTIIKFFGIFFFSAWSIFSLCRTRETIRARYSIPEDYCIGCEDLCCSVCCSCCTTAQLLRHTGEYETYRGVCCTKTGHEPGAPLTV